MERDNQYNNDSYNRHNRRDNQNEEMYNARDRYKSGGNYYGMENQHDAYHNVSHTKGDNYSQSSPGPVGGYGASSYRGSLESRPYNSYNSDNNNTGNFQNQEGSNRHSGSSHYHYGDPNTYMHGQRNTQSGRSGGKSGYEYNEDQGHGTTGRHYSGNYQSGDNYARQNNSYQSDGEGRRYNEFARDEQRSYNPGTIDMYQDRKDFNYSRSVNDHGSERSRGTNSHFEGNYDQEDFRYGNAEIRETDRSRQQNKSHNRRSSGPDYSADSPISGYGQSDLRG